MIKKKTKKIILSGLFFVFFISLFFLYSNIAWAQETAPLCASKYPNDGYCNANECPKEQLFDNSAGLCPESQYCCHTYVSATEIELAVPIFTKTVVRGIDGYIIIVYNYALAVLIPIVIVIIIYAGFKWIMSAGNPGKIGEAKKYISGAVIGLTIALLSWFILSLFDLQNISGLQLKPVLFEEEDQSILDEPGTGEVTPAKPSPTGGECYPVINAGSQRNNFGQRRADGARCHAGVDIYTKNGGGIQAVADGIVTAISYSFTSCKSGWGGPGTVGKVMIYHPSLDVTYNYAEIDAEDPTLRSLKVGQEIAGCEYLGIASHCGMLHFEAYTGKTSTSKKWLPGTTVPSGDPNWCAENEPALSNKPADLLDPTDALNSL